MPRFTYQTADGKTLSLSTEVPSERVDLIGQGWAEETTEAQQEKTVAELKDELKSLGLPTSGSKADLIERLDAGIPSDETTPSEAGSGTDVEVAASTDS